MTTFSPTSTAVLPTCLLRSWGPTLSTRAEQRTCGDWGWCSTLCWWEGEIVVVFCVKCYNIILCQVSISWCWTQRTLCKNKTWPVYSSRKSQFTSKMSYQMSTEERPKRENYDWRRSRPSLAAWLQQRERRPQAVPRVGEPGPGGAGVDPAGRVRTGGIQSEIIFRATYKQEPGGVNSEQLSTFTIKVFQVYRNLFLNQMNVSPLPALSSHEILSSNLWSFKATFFSSLKAKLCYWLVRFWTMLVYLQSLSL